MGRQLELFAAKKKGARKRAAPKLGRRPRVDRVGFVPHVVRPGHDWRHPVHVTMRRVDVAPSLRSERIYAAILEQLARAKRRGVRVIHFSIQHDHVHLMVEAQDRGELSRKMQLLFSRIGIAVNRVAQRRGSLFRDRHYRHELKTPTETRRALVYVMFNARKHQVAQGLDDRSSAAWFAGWHPLACPAPEVVARCRATHPDASPVSDPKTWLAQTGWRRAAGGPIRFDESPRPPR